MKKLILDYSKWRCGGPGKHSLGQGLTMLGNPEGFQCCIGQITLQMCPTLTTEDILNKGCPAQLKNEIELLSFKNIDRGEGDGLLYEDELEGAIIDSEITARAISINDDKWTTPQQKIGSLKALFAKAGYEIEVINQPLITN